MKSVIDLTSPQRNLPQWIVCCDSTAWYKQVAKTNIAIIMIRVAAINLINYKKNIGELFNAKTMVFLTEWALAHFRNGPFLNNHQTCTQKPGKKAKKEIIQIGKSHCHFPTWLYVQISLKRNSSWRTSSQAKKFTNKKFWSCKSNFNQYISVTMPLSRWTKIPTRKSRENLA